MPVQRTVPGVCHSFNSPISECTGDNCQELHVCLDFVTGRCPFGDSCTRTHRLTTVHNQAVLKANGCDNKNQRRKILKQLQKKFEPNGSMSNQQNDQKPKKEEHEPKQKKKSAKEPEAKEPPKKQDAEKDKQISRVTPSACIAYNNGRCTEASCPFLHVCFGYIMGSCKKKGKCPKEHNIYVGEQNIAVLRKYNSAGNGKIIFAKIRKGYDATAAEAAMAAAIAASDGASGGAITPPYIAARSCATLPDRLTCSVCFEPFIRATTLGCTHTFCEDCVRQAERQGQPCPLCRAPIATAVGSLVINDTVAEWFDGQDEETQRARRQLEKERRHLR